MGKVYRHIPRAPDQYLGQIEPQTGKVYRHRSDGPDDYLGEVNLEDGKIYRHRPGPDEYLGEVHLDDGEIFGHLPGPDQYVAKVSANGRVYRHKARARDDYLGEVQDMQSLAEGGAAFFLLLLPAVEEAEIEVDEG